MECGPAGGDPETEINSAFSGFLSNSSLAPSKLQLLSLLLFTIFLLKFTPLYAFFLIGCVVVNRWFQGTNRLRTHHDPDPNSHHYYQHGLFFLSSFHHRKHPVQIMAILESEKRPRGLRVPSLSSIKSFGKKSSEASQQQQHQPKMDSLPEALPPPPPDKQLPSVPTSMSPQAAPAPVAAPTPMRLPAASATDLNFSLDTVPMSDFGTDRYPMPGLGANRSTPNISNVNGNVNGNGIGHSNGNGGLAVPPPPVQRTPSNGSQRTGTSDGEPLEEYIPEPEPEPESVDRMYADISPGLEPVPDVEHADMDDFWTPPGYEPVAAPLTKLHFACYQEHKSMPPAANVWHALPCMTCQKFDREVRHRCVFCCLRICEGCYQNLQKCSRRSLDKLLGMIQS